MPPEIIGLFEKPHLLIAALLVGVVVGIDHRTYPVEDATEGMAGQESLALGTEAPRGQH